MGYRPKGRGASLAGGGASLAGGRRYHRSGAASGARRRRGRQHGAGVMDWAKKAFNFAKRATGAIDDFSTLREHARKNKLVSKGLRATAKHLDKKGPYRGYAHRLANAAARRGYGRRTYRRKKRMRGGGVFDDILGGISKVAQTAAPFLPLLL